MTRGQETTKATLFIPSYTLQKLYPAKIGVLKCLDGEIWLLDATYQ